ncbi:hypothetical protein LguiA_031639 [Lonicera macranthoides]
MENLQKRKEKNNRKKRKENLQILEPLPVERPLKNPGYKYIDRNYPERESELNGKQIPGRNYPERESESTDPLIQH